MNEIITPLVTGGVIGFAVGYGLTKLLKIAIKFIIIALGAVFAFMMWLQSLGIIAVNWQQLETVTAQTVDTLVNQTSGTGNIILETLQGWGLAFDASFVTGALLGIKLAK